MIGIDLVEVQRIKQSLKNKNFINKILTQNEINYVQNFVNKEEHIAGFFACKESVMKALENCKEIGFTQIEVCHNSTGKPYVVLSGNAKQVFKKSGYTKIEVSISQMQNFATAICVLG